MKRVPLFALAAAADFCTASIAIAQDMPPNPKAPAQHAERPFPKPTNLQVLPKDTSPEQLKAIMRSFSQSLGVHCNFCHEVNAQTHEPNFAADTKPDKAIARTMIAMTQEINMKFMSQIHDPDATPADKTVKCATCHRGNSMPAQFVPKPDEHDHPGGGMPPMQKPQ